MNFLQDNEDMGLACKSVIQSMPLVKSWFSCPAVHWKESLILYGSIKNPRGTWPNKQFKESIRNTGNSRILALFFSLKKTILAFTNLNVLFDF